jgi:hypothetical protein
MNPKKPGHEVQHPRPFQSSNLGEVLSQVSGGVEDSVRQHIVERVELGLRDYLAGVVNLNSLGDLGTPQVMLRVRTFQTILDEFRRIIDDRYPQVLETIGRNIGFNFGISLTQILRKADWIPLNFEALLGFWATFDSSAQMGQVHFDYSSAASGEAQVAIRIKNLFLTLGYGQDEPLRHCDFMIGYHLGAADVASMLWTRWISNTIYARPEYAWRALDCVGLGQERDGVTAFALTLRKEKLTDCRDTLAAGIAACETGNWVVAMIDARICLESALLHVSGEAGSIKVSFGRLLDQLRSVRVDLNYERWKNAYAVCSEFAHQVKAHNEIAVLGYLFLVWECLREAEGIELTNEQAGQVRLARQKFLVP